MLIPSYIPSDYFSGGGRITSEPSASEPNLAQILQSHATGIGGLAAAGYMGHEILVDDGGPQALTTVGWTTLQNTAAGAGTYRQLGIGPVWNEATGQLDLSQLMPGRDLLAVGGAGTLTTVVNNVIVDYRLRLRIGGAEQVIETRLPTFDAGAGTYLQALSPFFVPVTDEDITLWPAEIQARASADFTTATVSSFLVFVLRRGEV